MKGKICIAIALVSVVISCFFIVGCTPFPGYLAIDSRSALMKPTFFLCHDPYFQKPLKIGSVTVWKVGRPSEEKKRGELKTPLDDNQTFTPKQAYELWLLWEMQLNDYQTVWELELKFPDADSIIIGLWWRLLTPTVSSLTYGEVPWLYQEKVKALPLEPEELYIVSVDAAYSPRRTVPLRFIIRSNDTGVPDRLEYNLEMSYPWNDIFWWTRSYLKLY